MSCGNITNSQVQNEKVMVSLLLRVLSDDATYGWPAVLKKASAVQAQDPKDPLIALVSQINGIRQDPVNSGTVRDFLALIATLTGFFYTPAECCGIRTGDFLLSADRIGTGLIQFVGLQLAAASA